MESYAEKIVVNQQKIEQLSKNIKRDTDKRKKLMQENAHLSYMSLCVKYNCEGQELLDIIAGEHQKVEMMKANGFAELDFDEPTESSSADTEQHQLSFTEKQNPFED